MQRPRRPLTDMIVLLKLSFEILRGVRFTLGTYLIKILKKLEYSQAPRGASHGDQAPSSSGPGLRVLSPAIAGSNPAGVTTKNLT